jgi:hypothetical protein
MGKTKGPYKEEFPKDSTVQIADRAFLENFLKTWKLHHKLEPQQLSNANKIAKVKSVGFDYGGDELYELKGVPGTWHEQCLRAVVGSSSISSALRRTSSTSALYVGSDLLATRARA